MGAILPASAHVAGGKVFFADAKGVVRSLAIDGTVAVAATLPMTTTQQMLSFAVSPDGIRLLGTVYTIPTNALTCDGSWSGTFTFDTYSAANGAALLSLIQKQLQLGKAVTFATDTAPHGAPPRSWHRTRASPSSAGFSRGA